ncbi:putative baseplate assembly protein [Rhodovulum marinum]|uniref:Putative phage baseplate assembly protein n=1 Tax=Rhodovulum marinum TaxID=320662 RepID=A0A4R2Q084_9RHOB|nr:putative baseplate assembly protein [Rhodovulum marinum]TCP41857.1 putative phage baseplate assembly protein [Rhodovulum marinum]
MSEPPIRIGHPDLRAAASDACGCCEGVTLSTGRVLTNRPNLGTIAYRAGEHASFKASMLARLASSTLPALARLGTREDDDFTIALIDAWATVLDVLTFYNERHATEAFIGTATERFSIAEIARLIGYRLHPGSAAETDLVFLMEDPPGAAPDVEDLAIPEGTRVQSQPGPDEQAQVFETLADLDARVAWNKMRPRQNRRVALAQGDTGTWLAGQATALAPGDVVLIVHPQRFDTGWPGFSTGSTLWQVRRLTRVTPDATLDRTRIEWAEPLGPVSPAGETAPVHKLFALRRQVSLFGYNAPHPAVLTSSVRRAFGYSGGTVPANSPSPITGDQSNVGDWDFPVPQTDDRIVLDAVHKDFVRDGWAVLASPGGTQALYRIAGVTADAEARYSISGRASVLDPDRSGWVAAFASNYRRIAVHGASEELALAETPLRDFLSGTQIELDTKVPDLPEDRVVYLKGRRAQVEVAIAELTVLRGDVTLDTLPRGTRLTVQGALFFPAAPMLGLWLVTDPDGQLALTLAWRGWLPAVAADGTAPEISQRNEVKEIDQTDPLRTTLTLKSAILAPMDRASTVVHGNVARASHGEAASEILGAGDPAQPFQRFTLKQAPVTHLVASTENGVASTLTLRIDGVEWTEVPDLYQRGATARVFATTLSDTGETTVRFGDGISGARPPAGRDNIEAEYRKGLGKAGNVRAGQLSLAIDRPLGLKDVVNPMAATGGADAETSDAARRNAPIHTLTLGRVVSITDYRDFALGYPGIARADARWVWQGETRRIVVTVAGDDGAAVPATGPVFKALRDAYRTYGDPLVGFDLLSFAPARFHLGLKVAIDPAHEDDTVLAAVEAALRAAYAFDRRDFAQPVALSDVAATAHDVPGVVAVDIDRLYRETGPQTEATDHMLLQSRPGRTDEDGGLLAAEILTLSPAPFDTLEVMA